MTLRRPRGVLFDLDGTLLDTAADLHHALTQVLNTHRLPLVSLEQARPVASHGSAGLLSLGFGSKFNADTQADLRAAFLSVYAADPYSRTQYFDGISELLTQLDAQDVQYGIVTNKPTQFTQALLPHFPQLAACRAVVCGDTLDVAKPHPAPLYLAAEQLGLEPNECWYVGDAERDIQAGRAAGMLTVLAHYGYVSEQDTPALWQADTEIQYPLQLLDLWT
ncbi:HAD family hydrolase [Aliidiomarina maris]|uniref:Phosphoglycolate phosphatase n=1 Tax=Aliidiomarina maris TaxID=531312 RepID=A0A327X0Y1_9GAMM|nr:HAD-IA family hydrolase [Aliidiomarina maris]RAJ98848.1 phosphoglycolate phosphatase [Aliidiomarina maris]RUO24995.1 phosphoglycolate phosphatase [Aliidiomarina maris]